MRGESNLQEIREVPGCTLVCRSCPFYFPSPCPVPPPPPPSLSPPPLPMRITNGNVANEIEMAETLSYYLISVIAVEGTHTSLKWLAGLPSVTLSSDWGFLEHYKVKILVK